MVLVNSINFLPSIALKYQVPFYVGAQYLFELFLRLLLNIWMLGCHYCLPESSLSSYFALVLRIPVSYESIYMLNTKIVHLYSMLT